MTLDIAAYSFSYYELGFIFIAATLVGAAKTGVQGAAMVSVPLLAIVFGAKQSTGVMLPIMILADVFAIYYYHQHADWRDLRNLMPFALFGVVIGTALGNVISGQTFAYSSQRLAKVRFSSNSLVYRRYWHFRWHCNNAG